MVDVDRCKGVYGTFYVYKHDNLISSSFRNGTWYEWPTIKTALYYIKKDDIIVDAGANMGAHTIPYALRVGPQGKVHSFEIQTPIFEVLKMNVNKRNLKNVVLYRNAVGHKNTDVEINKVEYGDKLNYGGIGLGSGGDKVRMMTLDSLNLDRLDFIKADIEGAEPMFFYGAKETIKRCRPIILFENGNHKIVEEVRKTIDIPDHIAKFSILEYCLKLNYHVKNAPIKRDIFLIPREKIFLNKLENKIKKVYLVCGGENCGTHLATNLLLEVGMNKKTDPEKITRNDFPVVIRRNNKFNIKKLLHPMLRKKLIKLEDIFVIISISD